MGHDRDLVITAYGHDKTIDKIAVSSFDRATSYHDSNFSDANTYCDTINSLELSGNSWVLAKTVSENVQYSLDSFLPVNFDIILKLDNRSLQKVLREVDSYELSIAIRDEKENIKEKIFSNMSKRAARMLKEDMEYMGNIDKHRAKENQKNIVSIIKHLENVGEIIIGQKEETEK
jgi:flagellar motor switch protein FliG